ncbi:multidrug effflux MFS transporter [Cochlodiniinecator piscidefendens]|uniref:multidrug effflux MFS transporter n=1 Tax=Cochlodiniinecator piscidefendens TaxID=2715756 RepID=UPI00140BE8B2|nr:multidrug effflux MFS transporter [Cochlodiniinecator piscidefendens]
MPRKLPFYEFIALMAMLFATIAFSIDAMLPALPEIGMQLSPEDLNRAQLVITAFVFGMGLGTFFTGPLSDSFGRKPVLLTGSFLYAIGAIWAWYAQSIEGLLMARALQGLGVSGPRVVAMAIIRDLYAGRQMAKLMSFVMVVFSLVPAIAPSLGAVIIHLFEWRAIFLAFVLFAAITGFWLFIRQDETLPVDARIPFSVKNIKSALREISQNQMFVTTVAVQTLCFALLMATISSTQQIYDITFDEGVRFPLWFGATAILSSSAGFLNAALVERLGMRFLISASLTGLIAFSLLALGLNVMNLMSQDVAFYVYFLWTTGIFFSTGMTLGNLNTLAMEPMGHIAGIAASTIGAVSTVLGVMIAVPIGLAFNGTPVPLIVGVLFCAGLGRLIMMRVARLERVNDTA